MSLSLTNVAKLLVQASNRQQEDKAWHFYVSLYPHMEKQISFEEFYNPAKKEDKTISEEEILNNVKHLLDANKGSWVA